MRGSAYVNALTGACFALLACAPAFAQERDAQLALITELDGEVVIQRAADGTLVEAVWGTQLYKGDQVRTTSGAQVSLFFSNNNLITIGPNSSMTISAGPAPASSDSSPVKAINADIVADAASLTLHRSGAGEMGALGGLRSGTADASVDLLTPRQTNIQTLRPTFEWTPRSDDDEYVLKVFDEEGLVWSDEVSEASYVYPDGAPALRRDTQYYWQVEVDDLLDPSRSELVPFYLISDDALLRVADGEAEIANMFSDSPFSASYYYVLGLFYAKEGLLASAIESFSEIAARHDKAARPHEILGSLYYDVGLKDHAVKSLQRALTLSGAEQP